MNHLPHIVVNRVSKRFGGVRALTNVTLSVTRGSTHALVGENGAGKSTLGKIIGGVIRADSGTVSINGTDASYRSPREALRDGITVISQEVTLVPTLSVIENVLLAREPRRLAIIDSRASKRLYEALVEEAGFRLDPSARVGELPISEQKKVEILRALARNANVLVMDELTAALTIEERKQLFDIVANLKNAGRTLVYVTHFLEEALALADAVTILRDGEVIRTALASDETAATLVTGMLGRSLELAFPLRQPPPVDAPEVLRVKELSRTGAFDSISLTIRAGEIVGIAGLVGSGRTEVARAIFGADPFDHGVIEINGKATRARGTRNTIKKGVALIPESRKDQGLILERSVRENVVLAHLWRVCSFGVVHRRRETTVVTDIVEKVGVQAPGIDSPVRTLSGGNQQKVLFAKWMMGAPLVLIADEPTRGIDVGSKQAVYRLLTSFAERGTGILLISSELEEILGLSHRILVMNSGALVAEFESSSATETAVMEAAFRHRRAESSPPRPRATT